MRPEQITLSTIAVGSDSDTKLLTMLAQIGTGRYYFTERAQDIPKIATKETTIVTRSALIEGRVLPQLVDSSPILIGLTGGELPPLAGYVATGSRPRASTVLSSDQGDPLLAQWQYGLGRVVAWTSDVGGGWTTEWQDWDESSRFWQQAVRWTMPEPTQPGFQVRSVVVGDQVTLRAQSLRPDGSFADLLDTRVTVVNPNGQARELQLPQVAPGAYGLTTTAPAVGAYEARFVQYERGAVAREETVGFTVLGAAETRSVGLNRSLLERIATRTGGRELTDPTEAFARDVAPVGERGTPLWPWFAAAGLLLFPFDVAIRRLRLVRRR
jgi:Ca-activated chloride channel homolog